MLPERAPDPAALLKMTELPEDVEVFYAQAGAFTTWVLAGLAKGDLRNDPGVAAASRPDAALLKVLDPAIATDLPRSLEFESETAMQRDWAAWYGALRNPPRMPLMVLVEAATENRKDQQGIKERD